jgi:hypothetical protein
VPQLQSRYLWLQSPNVGERDLCSHPRVERIGNCATFADIGRIGGVGATQSPPLIETTPYAPMAAIGLCPRALSCMFFISLPP